MADVSSGIKLFGTTITLQNKQVVQKDDDHDHDRRQAKKADDVHEQTVEMKRPEKIIPCPRCKSLETKFCYFNNYNVNQPRHFCKGCQRYWTAGGALRNVPVGAGRRKTKPPGRELTGFPEGCLYEAAEVVHQFELDGVVEEWHVAEVAAVKGDFRHVFPVVKRRRSSGSGGQKCS